MVSFRTLGSDGDLLLAGYVLQGLCIPGELYARYQHVLLTYDPLSRKCIRLCLGLPAGRAVLRASENLLPGLESSVWNKIPFLILNLIVN